MPDAGSDKEPQKEKETGSRLGEVTPIAGGLHQGPIGPKGRWSKKRKAEVVIRILRGEPLDGLSRELGVEIYRLEEWRDKGLAAIGGGGGRREGGPPPGEAGFVVEKNGGVLLGEGAAGKGWGGEGVFR